MDTIFKESHLETRSRRKNKCHEVFYIFYASTSCDNNKQIVFVDCQAPRDLNTYFISLFTLRVHAVRITLILSCPFSTGQGACIVTGCRISSPMSIEEPLCRPFLTEPHAARRLVPRLVNGHRARPWRVHTETAGAASVHQSGLIR